MSKFQSGVAKPIDPASAALMDEIGRTINRFLAHTPMTPDMITGTIAFCAGASILGTPEGTLKRRQLLEMAKANVELGLEAMQKADGARRAPGQIILPNSTH